MRHAGGSIVASISNRHFESAAIIIAAIGLFERVVWLARVDKLETTTGEMAFVARAFAATGRLADAYGPGSGLTAHVTPVMPITTGLIYRVVGIGTPAAEAVLTALALAFAILGVVALNAAAKRLSIPSVARLAAIAFIALVPLNFSLELVAFRIWEGGVSTAIVAGVLALVLALDQRNEKPSWAAMGGLAALGGLTALISPPAALAIYACLGLLALRRRGLIAFAAAAGISAVLLVAISYPWAVRNEAAFGEKVWSRTNFGLNYALAFNEGAVSPPDMRASFAARLAEIDPYTSPRALAELKAMGGEPQYSRYLSGLTSKWVSTHPAQAMRIALRHVKDFYLPPRWLWSVYTDTGSAVPVKQAITWAVTILGLIGLALRLGARDWRYLYVAAVLFLPALPYLLVQPILRYHYTVASLLAFLAADLFFRLPIVQRLARGDREPGDREPYRSGAAAKTNALGAAGHKRRRASRSDAKAV